MQPGRVTAVAASAAFARAVCILGAIKDAWVLSASFGEVFNDTPQQNGSVDVAASQYDGVNRLVQAIQPEGGFSVYQWSPDLLQNLVLATQTPKLGSPLAPLVTSYAYDPIYNKPTRITDPKGLVTTMSYDAATGNLVSVVGDAGGSGHFNATQRFTYNGVGQVLTATDPLGSLTRYTYDSLGNPTAIVRDAGTGRLNQTTRMGYDALGDVASLTDPNGNLTQSAWDANRRLTQVTAPPAPQALVTAYSWDPDGRLVGTTQSANGSVLTATSAAYTPSGQLATATDARGNITRYAYDAADRLARVTDPVGRVTTYGYDALSRRTGVFNPAIQGGALLALGYTPDGLLASLADAAGHTTGYTYDGVDRLSATTFPDTSAESLTYDANGNLVTRKTRKGDTIAFAYDTLNRVCTKIYAASPVTCGGSSANYLVSYGYDLAGRLINVGDNSAAVTRPAASASYTASISYDAMNRPLHVGWSPAAAQTTPTASGTTFTYGYDATNRRIGATATDKSWWSYPTTAATIPYTANNLNQYSAVGSVAPTYDGNGNLTYDGTFTYGYDAESRLTSIKQGSTAVASYAYDAQGRRKSKTVGATTTMFVTDADNREVLEYDGTSGAIEKWYSFAPAAAMGPDAVLNEMDVAAGSRQTLIPDVQGSVVGTLASGGALSKIGYQPFGEHPSLAAGSFRYTARRYDAETAGSTAQPSGLYYYRARMYSPTWGRFLEPDPIGYAGGSNLYAFADNDPLDQIDPSGKCPACIAVGAVIGAAIGGTHAYLEGGNVYAITAGAAVGAVAGAVIATTAPITFAASLVGSSSAAATYGVTAGIGAAGGFGVDVATQLANIATSNQHEFNVTQLIVSTAAGSIAAGAGSAFIKAGEAIAIGAGSAVPTAVGVAGELAAGQIEASTTALEYSVNKHLK